MASMAIIMAYQYRNMASASWQHGVATSASAKIINNENVMAKVISVMWRNGESNNGNQYQYVGEISAESENVNQRNKLAISERNGVARNIESRRKMASWRNENNENIKWQQHQRNENGVIISIKMA
jgi:hypothetical protein